MKKKIVKEQDSEQDSKQKKTNEQYKCGEPTCGKFYHSYTAFYNHCKKSHDGDFPKNSLYNDELFMGPSKNRGRPRIKKNEAKDSIQIQSMKKENQLIQFLGTLKTKKAQELIVYVQNPVERIQSASIQVRQWLRQSGNLTSNASQYLKDLQRFNQIINQNDLPQFYDPIQIDLLNDKLDSYNFASIYNFMTKEEFRYKFDIKYSGRSLLFKIFLCWLGRILSQKLFNQVLYIVMQIEEKLQQSPQYQAKPMNIKQKDILIDKGNTLKKMILTFFEYFMKEHETRNSEIKVEKFEDKFGVDEF